MENKAPENEVSAADQTHNSLKYMEDLLAALKFNSAILMESVTLMATMLG